MSPLLEDPWILSQIDNAIAPYVGRLSPGDLAWMREQLAETLAADGPAATLLRRAKPIHLEESGEVRRDAVPTETKGEACAPPEPSHHTKVG